MKRSKMKSIKKQTGATNGMNTKEQGKPINRKSKIHQEETPLLSWIGVLVIALLPFFMIRFSEMRGFANQVESVHLRMRIALGALLILAIILYVKKKLTPRAVLILLVISGVVMRVGYLTYTNWMERVYDLGIVAQDGVGSGAYVLYHALEGHLPPSNEYQFYQPPLYFFLSAAAIRLMAGAKAATANPDLLKWAMAVSCVASCLTLVVIQKIMDAWHIQRKYQIPAMALAAFMPNWIFMGGRVNNDAVVTLFMVLIVYFTIRWYYHPSMKNIIPLALSFGFGIMSKISCGTLAIFTGSVMLYRLYTAWKEKKVLPLVGQFSVFAGISFPLALWYPIRNLRLFGQNLTFVHDVGKNSGLYTGKAPLSQRMFTMPVFSVWSQPYAITRGDINVWMMMARTAVFGEWPWEGVPKIISVGLFSVNFLLMVVAFAAMVYVFVKGSKEDYFSRFAPAVLWAVVFISYVSFNISYPYSCTADARYIPVAVMVGMISLAQANERLDGLQTAYGKWIPFVGKMLTALFCIASTLMYA